MQEAFFTTSAPLVHTGLADYGARVASMVTPQRYGHILRVVSLAGSIATGNGFDPDEKRDTLLAALLHDAARDMSAEELMRLAPPSIEMERRHPLVLHGRASRRLAEEWGVEDKRVLDAIEGHVFGVSTLDRVGMAVYVADVSEPGRGVNDDVRELAICNVAAAYRLAVVRKVDYLNQVGKSIHPTTLKVYAEIVEA